MGDSGVPTTRRTRRLAMTAVLVLAAGLLTACADGAEMAQEYVDHTDDHPLDGGRIMRASGYLDTSECGCSWMKVVFRIDGADGLPADQETVAANLASVLLDACAWSPSEVVDEEWVVERLGQWHEVDMREVMVDDEYGAVDDCDQAAVERRAAELIDRVVQSMALDGVADDSSNQDFGHVTLGPGADGPTTLSQLRQIWGHPVEVTP
jgi:hypothetical protein